MEIALIASADSGGRGGFYGALLYPTADVYVRTDTLSRKRVRYGSLYTYKGDIIRLKKQAINHRVNATESYVDLHL